MIKRFLLGDSSALRLSIMRLVRLYFVRHSLLWGMACCFVGSALLNSLLFSSLLAGVAFLLLRVYERKMRRSVALLVRKKCEKLAEHPDIRREVQNLRLEMEEKKEQMHTAYLEFEDLRSEHRRLDEEHERLKEEYDREIKKREALLGEYQKTMVEQRTILEKKQVYIAQLENKVRELMYEIRALLQLEEPVTTALPPVDMLNREEVQDYYMGNRLPAFDLDLALSRIVDCAERFTGVDHLGSRFLKGATSYAIDLRRLFDSLRDETAGVVFFYSMNEKKIIFANNYVKTLLGYSPEKFVNNFASLVKAGLRVWGEALEKIQTTRRCALVLITKTGEEKKVECEMKRIQKGPFVGNVIGMIIE